MFPHSVWKLRLFDLVFSLPLCLVLPCLISVDWLILENTHVVHLLKQRCFLHWHLIILIFWEICYWRLGLTALLLNCREQFPGIWLNLCILFGPALLRFSRHAFYRFLFGIFTTFSVFCLTCSFTFAVLLSSRVLRIVKILLFLCRVILTLICAKRGVWISFPFVLHLINDKSYLFVPYHDGLSSNNCELGLGHCVG